MPKVPLKTTFKDKAVLISLGILFAFILLEISLRLGGAFLLYARDQANKESPGQKGVYKILCIGESTTFMGEKDSYPRQLERILNAQSQKVTFKVFNKGVPSITTAGILSQIQNNIENYQPDMIVAMMGINDVDNTEVFKNDLQTRAKFFFGNIRVAKVIKLFFLHARYRYLANITFLQDEISSDSHNVFRAQYTTKNPWDFR